MIEVNNSAGSAILSAKTFVQSLLFVKNMIPNMEHWSTGYLYPKHEIQTEYNLPYGGTLVQSISKHLTIEHSKIYIIFTIFAAGKNKKVWKIHIFQNRLINEVSWLSLPFANAYIHLFHIYYNMYDWLIELFTFLLLLLQLKACAKSTFSISYHSIV